MKIYDYNDRKFHVQDAQSGSRIDSFDTIEEAINEIKTYIEQDKEEGNYTPGLLRNQAWHHAL